MAGLDVNGLMKSPLGQAIREQVSLAGMSGIQGAEILQDIDRIVVSSLGNVRPEDSGDAPFLAILSGRFRLDWLRKLAASEGATLRTYRTVEIIAPPKAQPSDVHFALIDAQTILAGDRKSVLAAIDRSRIQTGQPPVARSLVVRARDMADRNDVWIVSTVPLDQIAGKRALQVPFSADIEAVEAGVSFHEGARLDLRLATRSEESARSIATGLQLLIPLVLKQQPAMAEFAQKVQIAAGDTEVRLALALDAKDVERGFGQLRASYTPPGSRALVRADVPIEMDRSADPPAEPPRKRVIRIEGLDEGPKEIPYPNP